MPLHSIIFLFPLLSTTLGKSLKNPYFPSGVRNGCVGEGKGRKGRKGRRKRKRGEEKKGEGKVEEKGEGEKGKKGKGLGRGLGKA